MKTKEGIRVYKLCKARTKDKGFPERNPENRRTAISFRGKTREDESGLKTEVGHPRCRTDKPKPRHIHVVIWSTTPKKMILVDRTVP